MSDNVPNDLHYTEEHEWVRLEGNIATVGITRFAVEQLGDVTQVDLPREGETVKMGDVLGSVESVKAVSDVYVPLTGKVVKVNSPLQDSPEYLNEEPFDGGWMVQIEMSKPEEMSKLMDAKAYEDFLKDHEG